MKPKEFCYWLQGYFEVAEPKTLTEEQVKEVRAHLDTVFTPVTPSASARSFSGSPASRSERRYC